MPPDPKKEMSLPLSFTDFSELPTEFLNPGFFYPNHPDLDSGPARNRPNSDISGWAEEFWFL